jgi:hypothetical protein
MKKILIAITALTIVGCEEQSCTECVQTITVKYYSPSSVVIKKEESENVRVICDEDALEGVDGAFVMSEESFGNSGHYKQTTKSTTCN